MRTLSIKVLPKIKTQLNLQAHSGLSVAQSTFLDACFFLSELVVGLN